MSEKILNSRIILKHDVESNWQLATGFAPLKGEVVIYDPDSNCSYSRLKIGNGVDNVNSLPFVNDALRVELLAQINDVDDKVDVVEERVTAVETDIHTLVGDTSVSEQIEAAQILHVGPDRPTNPNIKVWINTAEEEVVSLLPRMTTINLPASAWVGSSEPYSQAIEIATVTPLSKIDLQPTAQQIVDLQNAEISLMIDNDNGELTCYAIGNKPTSDYTIQVFIQEVTLI